MPQIYLLADRLGISVMDFLARLRERFRPSPTATADSAVAFSCDALAAAGVVGEGRGSAMFGRRTISGASRRNVGIWRRMEEAFVARSDHGCLPLAEEDLPFYAALYGGHHIAKLTAAFAVADLGKLSGATLEIYDWGCGQAIASCLLIEFLRELCVRCSVRRVTLIEPGRFALERGTELLTRTLGGKEPIRAVCASFGDLTPEIVRAASPEDVKIHLFANILDVDGMDSGRLVKLITAACPGRNEFICVSPRYPFSRVEPFAKYFAATLGPAAVTNLSRNREPLTARIFSPRLGDFREQTITQDEARFAVQIPLRSKEADQETNEISDPFGRESFTVRASRSLRQFFRGY